MPVIVFMERLRVCVRGRMSVTVSVDTSQCPCPVRVYGHGSVLIVFLTWTRVRVRVRRHVLWWRHCSVLWWRHCKEPITKGSKSNNAKVCKRPKMKGILQFSSFFQVQCTDHSLIAQCVLSRTGDTPSLCLQCNASGLAAAIYVLPVEDSQV